MCAAVWEVMFDRCHPNNLFSCSEDGGLWHWDVNSGDTTDILQQAHISLQPQQLPSRQHIAGQLVSSGLHTAAANEKSESSEYVSPWLSGAVGHGNPYIQDYSPSQGLLVAVNSLDIESRHLLSCTDKEALFVIPNLSLR